MRNFNQKGVLHIGVLIVLLVAVVAGVILVGRPAVFNSRADVRSGLDIIGDFYQDGSSTSRLLRIKPMYAGGGTPTYFRLSNDASRLENGTVFKYIPVDSDREYSLWNLSIPNVDNQGQALGRHRIYAQFLVNEAWTAPITAQVNLKETNNNLKLSASCNLNLADGASSIFPVTVKWDAQAADYADQMNMLMFRGEGGYYSDVPPVNFSDGTNKLIISSIANSYTIFATATKGDQVVGTSEYSFSCTEPDPNVKLNNPVVNCNSASCDFGWKNSGQTPKFSELAIDYFDPVVNSTSTPIHLVTGKNSLSVGINKIPLPLIGWGVSNPWSLVNGTYPRFGVIGLKAAVDPEKAALLAKTWVYGPKFEVAVPLSNPAVSCSIAVTQTGQNINVTYSGRGGKVRAWLAGTPSTNKLTPELIQLSGLKTGRTSVLREFPANVGKATYYGYELDNFDSTMNMGPPPFTNVNNVNVGGIVVNINSRSFDLSLPKGDYQLNCDVLSSKGSCTGNLDCMEAGQGGTMACQDSGFSVCQQTNSISKPYAVFSTSGNLKCAQVETLAKNPLTLKCQSFPTPCDVPADWVKVDTCSSVPVSSAQVLYPRPNNTGMKISCDLPNMKILVSGDSKGDSVRFGKYSEYGQSGNPAADAINSKSVYISGPVVWPSDESAQISLNNDNRSPIDKYFVERGVEKPDRPDIGNYEVKSYVDFICPSKL